MRIDLAFGVDRDYAPHLSAALRSIAATTRDAPVRAFVATDARFEAALRRRVEADAPQIELTWLEAPAGAPAGKGHISPATFHRLSLPGLLPAGVSRAIYLDADVVVLRSLRALAQADLGGAEIGAVEDAGVCARGAQRFAKRHGLAPGGLYFNAGVLVLDVDRLRRSGAFARAAAAARAQPLEFLDQDALNIVFWGRWARLDPIWNVQQAMLIESMPSATPQIAQARRRRPGVVHFTTAEKPWTPGAYSPFAWLYWRALAGSSFYAETAARAGLDAATQARMFARWARRWAFLSR